MYSSALPVAVLKIKCYTLRLPYDLVGAWWSMEGMINVITIRHYVTKASYKTHIHRPKLPL